MTLQLNRPLPAHYRIPPRDSLYELMPFKRALVSEFGAEKGFEYYKQVQAPEADHLRLAPLRSLHAVASARASSFREMAPAGEPFVLPAPKVLGAGNHRPLIGETRSLYLAAFDDVRARGRSAFVDCGDCVALDFEGRELARIDDQLDLDPAIFQTTNETAWLIEPPDDSPTLELNEAFYLLGPHTYAFGHWMWEYLPKYVAARLWGDLPPVPILLDKGMPATHRQSLELLYPGVEMIELPAMMTARIRRLWVVPSLMYMPVLERMNERFDWSFIAGPAGRYAPLIAEMVRRTGPAFEPATQTERIFLGRRGFRHRKLVNHAAIEAEAVARGFTVVYPEDLSFAEQVRLLRHARFVVGPEGSAMFLAFFAQPGAKACILNHTHTAGLPCITGLLREIGVETIVVTGAHEHEVEDWPHMADYRIDEEAFRNFLVRWIAGEI